jgi:ketosteroid isomerase-like protein
MELPDLDRAPDVRWCHPRRRARWNTAGMSRANRASLNSLRQPLGVHRRQSTEFVVAVQQVADAAAGQGQTTASQFGVDLGKAAMLLVTQRGDGGAWFKRG